MARIGRSLQDLAAEIERRADAKQDYIAPVSKLEMVVVDQKPALALANGSVKTFPANALAHGQIGEYVGIPAAYYRRLHDEDPELLARNVNRWMHDQRKDGKGEDRRMIRTLDAGLRAFLSDRYRALENEDLAEVVLPILLEKDLLILSCEITERRLYIKAVDRSIEKDVPTGKSMGDGGHTIFDTCSPAITISNSEVGSGALSIETGVYTRACTNLAMFGSQLRKYHTGKRAEVSDEVYSLLTDETRQAGDKAVWLQTRDLVTNAFAQAQFDALMQKLGHASKDRIEPESVVEVVKRAGKRFAFTEGEQKGILARLIEGADLSRYGLHSAITRHSQEEAVDYDRATELERIGGEVIDLDPSQWRVVTDVKAKEVATA